ncbi:hypothetical protein MHK_007290, partial [Candidatus Magnetomorum sp. HK-1]
LRFSIVYEDEKNDFISAHIKQQEVKEEAEIVSSKDSLMLG